jgi:hypothetical protein
MGGGRVGVSASTAWANALNWNSRWKSIGHRPPPMAGDLRKFNGSGSPMMVAVRFE